jgi:mRNA interferase RelE/StbE
MYALKFHRAAEKELRKIIRGDRTAAEKIAKEAHNLRQDSRPHGSQHLIDNLYRIRVGEYRVIYAIFDSQEAIVVCKIARRSEETYKNLDVVLGRALRVLQEM